MMHLCTPAGWLSGKVFERKLGFLGKLVSATGSWRASQGLKALLMRSAVRPTNVIFFFFMFFSRMLENEMCQRLEDLHDSGSP